MRRLESIVFLESLWFALNQTIGKYISKACVKMITMKRSIHVDMKLELKTL